MIPFLLLLLCAVILAVSLGGQMEKGMRLNRMYYGAPKWWKSEAVLILAVLLIAAVFVITAMHAAAYFDLSSYRGPQ